MRNFQSPRSDDNCFRDKWMWPEQAKLKFLKCKYRVRILLTRRFNLIRVELFDDKLSMDDLIYHDQCVNIRLMVHTIFHSVSRMNKIEIVFISHHFD